MKIALVQTRTPATLAASVAHVLPLVREAVAGGAKFIATPEGTNVLQKDRVKLASALTCLADDPVVLGLRELAGDAGVWILVGSALVRRDDGKAANRCVLISPQGAITATYDKLHMFDVDLPT
ncbi:MAG TPA: nitrilase-related carbon-nitrogen hydrolase, partial [Phenylobacterium sp.]|nr:nitrilase-related carbon-nitrogen hydrolase [Phenylobacterium sp.]